MSAMKSRSTIKAWVYVLLILASSLSADVYGQSVPKAIVLAWDGTVPAFVHELLRNGKLPNLAKLIQGGSLADDVMPGYPALTAPGFASLWTGAPPRVTGISGNRVPRLPANQFTILQSSVGFSPALLRAEPIWESAERAGRKVVTSYAPLAGAKSELAVHLQGYSGIVGRDGVITGRASKAHPAADWENVPESVAPPLEISFTIAGSTFLGLLIDEPADPQEGYDTLLVSDKRDGKAIHAKLKAAAPGPGSELFWSGPIDVHTNSGQSAIVYLRLFDLKPDSSDFFLYFTRPTRPVMTAQPELLHEASPSIKAFVGNGANVLYMQGALGLPISKGGDGAAEIRYLETVTFVQHQLMETARWTLEHLPWDLFIAYTPYPDEAEHLWRGYLEPKLPGYRPEIAARLRPFLERVYQTMDDFLGLLITLRPENTVVALVSDHGMDASNKLLAINKALEQSELLTLDERNRVDLAKTKVLYPSINNGYLLINSTERKDGIVSPDEREEIVRRTREALLAIRDGDRQVITDVYDAATDGATLGIGGDSGGDLYIDLLPGYELDPKINSRDLITTREPHGTHGFNPARQSMHTLMVFNGPGIKTGAELKDVRIIDFAPTLSRALQLPAPRDAWGRVIEEAFIDPH
jgi:predicted AlkP superfamily phosphohydrolase/phosphomutase